MTHELGPWLRDALLGGLATVVLFALLEHAWSARVRRRRLRRALWGEREAVAVLEDAGFSVDEAQVTRTLHMEVAGERLAYDVRVDYLARDRAGDLHVAEVKTGPRATDPLHPPTRRQLLEYEHGFPEAAGVLLVDMEQRDVLPVRFRRAA